MGASLRLCDGALDAMSAFTVGLYPLAVFDADQTALDLDGRQADIRPENEEVNLVLGCTVADVDRMSDCNVVRQLVAEPSPDGLFSFLPGPEFRLVRNTSCHVPPYLWLSQQLLRCHDPQDSCSAALSNIVSHEILTKRLYLDRAALAGRALKTPGCSAGLSSAPCNAASVRGD